MKNTQFSVVLAILITALPALLLGIVAGQNSVKQQQCPEPTVVKEIEYVHTETVIQPRCEPCIEIRAEEDFIWVYKAGMPVAYFPREFLLNQ